MSSTDNNKWSRAPVSALGLLISGQSPPSRLVNREGQGTPYVSGPEQWTGEQVYIDKWTTASAKIAPEGSIFIVMKGFGVGTVFPGTSAAIGRDIAAFIPYKPLNRDFILLALRERCKGLLEDARGHIPGLSRSMLFEIWLDVPPLAEQARISHRIYDAENLLVRAREQLLIARNNASDIRTAIFSDAFSGKASEAWRSTEGNRVASKVSPETTNQDDESSTGSVTRGRFGIALGVPSGPVPPDWTWRRLTDIAELRTGHTPSRREPDYWDGDIPWIGILDAKDNYGKVINDTQQHITLAGLENSSAEVLPVGTLCLSRTASLGYVVVTGAPMATSQDFLNWTCLDELDGDWLLWLFIAERYSFREFGYGSTHKTIYMEDAERIHVLLPPLAEQREIVRFIEDGVSRVEALTRDLDRSDFAAIQARDETISSALLGRLGTGDRADEDADILLSRLEEHVEVARTTPSSEATEEQRSPALSVARLVAVVRDSSAGLSPERLFANAGYRAEAVDIFFSHIKAAVASGAVKYDATNDLVVADEA